MTIYYVLLRIGKKGTGVYPVLIELQARSESEALKRIKGFTNKDEFWRSIKKSPEEYFITTDPEILDEGVQKRKHLSSKTIELKL